MMRKIEIIHSLNNLDHLVGYLHIDESGDSPKYYFEYSDDFFMNGIPGIIVDKDITFARGIQRREDPTKLYSFLSDTISDKWGRYLLNRVEAKKAKEEKRGTVILSDFDLLLATPDNLRFGALRFKEDDEYLGEDKEVAKADDIVHLGELAYDSLFEKGKDLTLLIDSGISLKGDRPKVTFLDKDNELYIAKFPLKRDKYDVLGVEFIYSVLAKKSGIDVIKTKLIKTTKGSLIIFKRFDREGKNRYHFVSFNTLFGLDDKEGKNITLLEVASKLREYSVSPRRDLEELFSRIAFSFMIGNKSLNLSDFALLLKNDGYHLSPFYTLNPLLNKENGLRLAKEGNNMLSNLVKNARYFMLDEKIANEKVKAMRKTLESNMENVILKIIDNPELKEKLLKLSK